jgi:hypothetical protein
VRTPALASIFLSEPNLTQVLLVQQMSRYPSANTRVPAMYSATREVGGSADESAWPILDLVGKQQATHLSQLGARKLENTTSLIGRVVSSGEHRLQDGLSVRNLFFPCN